MSKSSQTPIVNCDDPYSTGDAGRKDWARIVKEAEGLRGRSWKEMQEQWGDWGRDGTMYVAVRHGRHRLSEVVKAIGGMSYNAGAQAVRRFARGLSQDAKRVRFVETMRRRLQSQHDV